MRILLIILLFLATKVYAEELTGLFGIKFAENYKGFGIFDANILKEIDSIEQLGSIKKHYENAERTKKKYKIDPPNKNQNFDAYRIITSDLTGTVLSIMANGKPIDEINACNNRINFYDLFFNEKYSSSYKIESRKLEWGIIINFYKAESSNDNLIETYKDYAVINYHCQGYIIGKIMDSDIIKKYEINETNQILNIINSRINELIIDDSDSTGL